MIRDPFGGWDWDGIKQLAFTVFFACALLSLFSQLGGDNWYGPYVWAAALIQANATVSIIVAMVFLMGLWWYEQFQGGYY